jgi:hypothetical protein
LVRSPWINWSLTCRVTIRRPGATSSSSGPALRASPPSLSGHRPPAPLPTSLSARSAQASRDTTPGPCPQSVARPACARCLPPSRSVGELSRAASERRERPGAVGGAPAGRYRRRRHRLPAPGGLDRRPRTERASARATVTRCPAPERAHP